MTNLASIAGGTLWALMAVLLLGAALEPVSTDNVARVQIAQVSSNIVGA